MSVTAVKEREQCNAKCECYSRVVGFYRPVDQWNIGKKEEYKDRKVYASK